jgi:glycosyltransferase involved in cell wall biosynthesis
LSKLIHHRLKWLPLFLKKRLLQIVEAWSYDHASIIIANSRTYQSRLKMRGYQSTVINPGLQLHQIPQLPKSIPRDKKRFVIGYLGRLVPEKGVHLLIEAVELLVSEPGLPVFHVEIAGEGEERLKLEQLVSQYHLEHCVSFLGQVENVSVLTHWDILVNPCLVNAPIEMVNAEAAFLGVPVICFGNLVYPETVVHQKTGLKVLPKTPIVLKNAIKSLLTNIDLISTLKKNGPAFASTHYRFQDQVKKLESLYQKHNLID